MGNDTENDLAREVSSLRDRLIASETLFRSRERRGFWVGCAATGIAALSLAASVAALWATKNQSIRLQQNEFSRIAAELEDVNREYARERPGLNGAEKAELDRSAANKRSSLLAHADLIAAEIGTDNLPAGSAGVIGASHQDAHNFDKAYGYYRRAANATSPADRAAAHRSLGGLHFHLDRPRDGRLSFERALAEGDDISLSQRCVIVGQWVRAEHSIGESQRAAEVASREPGCFPGVDRKGVR